MDTANEAISEVQLNRDLKKITQMLIWFMILMSV